MTIERFLLPRKKKFVQEWFNHLVGSYPPETARLLKKETNQFANPVGYTAQQAMGEIFDEFFGQNRPEKISPLLDKILRIRAVQDFMPSGAIQFVFQLKKIARQILQAEIVEGGVTPGDMFEFDDKVDVLALAAMDVYVGCRENLYRVRVEEIKNRTSRLLHRAGIIADVRSQKPEDEQQ
jgi:hypothetical protein